MIDSKPLNIDAYKKGRQDIELSDEVAAVYGLDKWAADFSLMTAGYRDRLNPTEAADPKVAFNLVTLAILGEAKARVFERKFSPGKQIHVHVGGETRPHTQEFIALLARVYAAHNMTVHLRAQVKTTPIWYSSFGVFYEEFETGDNLTASHSPFFKGGWKPMDSQGKQLLSEEAEIISEVKNIVGNREAIGLASWGSEKIVRDFDVDEAYAEYQQSLIIDNCRQDINLAVKNGFRCAAGTAGGSMKATTERLFPMLGISTGPAGVIRYLFGEEDSRYHGVGQLDGENFGPDPGKEQVYKHIGAQEILLENKADVVFLWDPDGDRFNIVTKAPNDRAATAEALGLEIDTYPGADTSIVYFTPNQLFFMLTAYRIRILREAGLLKAYDWFVTPSISTSRSIGEIAARENIPVAYVRVGFKYMGEFCEWLENRTDSEESFVNAIGEKSYLGRKPRALIMCEESGGAVFGGTELLKNKSGSAGMIALREKDGMQFALMALSLATFLSNSNRTFADYYCRLIEEYDIQNRFFNREDVRLYDETLAGLERTRAIAKGILVRDKIMDFFMDLAKRVRDGAPLDEIQREINSRLVHADKPIPVPKLVRMVGRGKLLEGSYLEFADFWFLIRASGTDALLRYYIEGKNKNDIEAYRRSFVNLKI